MTPQRVLITPAQHQTQQIRLTPAQQHYLQRVLRLGPGERFIALDGQGRQWLVQLTPDPHTATVVETLNDMVDPRLTVRIALLAALPKGNGFDEVVRQTTELGVTHIQPVISDRTLVRPSDQKLERWQRIAKEATEQCERLIIPEISPPLTWANALTLWSENTRFLCVTRLSAPHLLACLQSNLPPSITVAIGPEGGWTDAEVEAAVTAGFQPVSLGPNILRAVTAPMVALSLIKGILDLPHTVAPPRKPMS